MATSSTRKPSNLPRRIGDIIDRQIGNGADADAPSEARQLPLWHDLERAMPNMIARSALFAPIARGRRAMHERSEIASRSDVSILYSGRQLDMADADVFMQALEIAKRKPLDQPFTVNRADFLRAISRPLGNSQYTWLDNVLKRLKFTALTINHGTQLYELSLVAEWGRDKESAEYVMMISSKIVKMFGRQEFGLIDWQSRFQLEKRVELAKWMQTYVASHERGKEHRIGLRLLHEWSGYKGPIRHFRSKMQDARCAKRWTSLRGSAPSKRAHSSVARTTWWSIVGRDRHSDTPCSAPPSRSARAQLDQQYRRGSSAASLKACTAVWPRSTSCMKRKPRKTMQANPT